MADDPSIPFGPGSPGFGPGGVPPGPPPPTPSAVPAAPAPAPAQTPVVDRTLRPPPAQPEEAGYASWGSRCAAQVIDWLVLLVPSAFVGLLVIGALVGNDNHPSGLLVLGTTAAVLVAVLIVAIFYGPLLMRRDGPHNGQTWGMQAVGIRVVRDSGEPFGFGTAAVREIVLKGLGVGFACFVIPVLPFFVNYLWPLWDDENRALHDMGADTHVFRVEPGV
jgi:uncharacterized RDD family membrane protein YckC